MLTETPTAPAAETTSAAAPATETTPSANEFSSFLGVEATELPSLRPAQNPEPAGTETHAESESEAEVPAGEEDAGEGEELETIAAEDETQPDAEATEEMDNNWLPAEQAKEFPLATLKEYADRRGYKWDPNDESQMRLLRDKLNTDIYVEQLRQDLEAQPAEETISADEPGAETDPAASATDPASDPRASHYQHVDAVVSTLDKQATEELGRGLLGAMGVNADPQHLQALQNALRNPQTTPQQRAEIQQHLDLVQNAGKIGTTLARGAVDLIMTAVPSLLPQMIEAAAPGLLGAYQNYQSRVQAGSSWEQVRTAKDGQGHALYPNLPAYGTAEFSSMVRKAEKTLGLTDGALGEMASKGLIREAYVMVARASSGQRVNPATVQRAVNAGRQQERTQQQRRAAGRALGAGATSQQFQREEPGDPVRDALRTAIAEQNSISDPFKGATTRSS